ncbi:MAG: phosphatase PAP2 family protein [Longimicrobiales bacterium]|nr:phosphatase PAP2 family protein [Longimicrobiales bacterium]
MRALPVASLGGALIAGDEDGALDFALGFGLNGVATAGLKWLVHKDRPDGSDANSFPSGHTSVAFQSASFLHLRYGLAYGGPAYLLASYVGFSRVHARKHFLEDVLVGAALGVASSAVFTRDRDDDRNPTPAVSLGMTLAFGSGLPTRFGIGVPGSNGN